MHLVVIRMVLRIPLAVIRKVLLIPLAVIRKVLLVPLAVIRSTTPPLTPPLKGAGSGWRMMLPYDGGEGLAHDTSLYRHGFHRLSRLRPPQSVESVPETRRANAYL